MDPSLYDEDWYRFLFNRMMSTLKQPEDYKNFRNNKVSFITFNYDISLEYFFYRSFYNTFWESRNQFDRCLKEFVPFSFIHVYGKIGDVELGQDGGQIYRKYFFRSNSIENLSEGIRIVGEGSEGELYNNIKKLISSSQRIFILGFGYAEENLDEIGFQNYINDKHQIYGTAKGMTKREIESSKRLLLKKLMKHDIKYHVPLIEDKNSYDLLREYL